MAFGFRASKTKDPVICPARVEVKQVRKNPVSSRVLFLEFRFSPATDCKGETRIISPAIWNHVFNGNSQAGPTVG